MSIDRPLPSYHQSTTPIKIPKGEVSGQNHVQKKSISKDDVSPKKAFIPSVLDEEGMFEMENDDTGPSSERSYLFSPSTSSSNTPLALDSPLFSRALFASSSSSAASSTSVTIKKLNFSENSEWSASSLAMTSSKIQRFSTPSFLQSGLKMSHHVSPKDLQIPRVHSQKKLELYTNDHAVLSVKINGTLYALMEIGSGKHYKVYEFKDKKSVVINYLELLAEHLVVKVFHTENAKVLSDKIFAYRMLELAGVDVARCYVGHERFTGSYDPTFGDFAICEKMRLTCNKNGWNRNQPFDEIADQEKQLLMFVKKHLNYYERNRIELIGDFYPRNIMFDKAGKPNIIDPSLPNSDPETMEITMFGYLRAWSNGNQNVFNFLIRDFSAETKKIMCATLAKEMAENQGAFILPYSTDWRALSLSLSL